MSIHPTAIIDAQANIAADVTIGAYTIIKGNVNIGSGCDLSPHTVIYGPTTMGANNRFHSHTVIGDQPQDQKYDGSTATLHIGNNNTFREFCTIHRGVEGTRIENNNLFMAYSHVAHDCTLGSNNILSNGATLGGHVQVADHVVFGGLCAVHQHCRIGRNTMIAGGSMVVQDVPPFVIAQGDRAQLYGLNRIGLRRKSIPSTTIDELHRLYRILFLSRLPRKKAITLAEQQDFQTPETKQLLQFFNHSTRGICRATGQSTR